VSAPALPPRPARILPTIVTAQFAGASIWFAANAVLPELQRAWGFSQEAVGHVTSAVQSGFIAGTLVFAFLAIADRYSPRLVYLACALAGACANLLALAADGNLAFLLATRFATGFFLAGIYPVGMKIASGWSVRWCSAPHFPTCCEALARPGPGRAPCSACRPRPRWAAC
jgi:MFS family permease